MKLFIIIAAIFTLQNAFAGGDNVGNGGDICEKRIQTIRNDLQAWILLGGGSGLHLPGGVTFAAYNQLMLANMASAKISCTDQILKIGSAEKTCINYSNSGSPLIICNTSRFAHTNSEDQYVLVHHEYAGLSGIEVNSAEESDYRVSNQIAYFLEDQIVKKLVVKPPPPQGTDPFDEMSCVGTQLSKNDIFQKIPLPNSTSKVIGNFQIFARKRTCYGNSMCQPWKDISKISQMNNLRYDFTNSSGFNSTILSFEKVSPSSAQFVGQIQAKYVKNEVVVSFVGDLVQTEEGYTYPSGNYKRPHMFGPYLELTQFAELNETPIIQLLMLGSIPAGPIGESYSVKGRGLIELGTKNGGRMVPQMQFKKDSLTSHCAKLTSAVISWEKDANLNIIHDEYQFVLYGNINQ